MTEIIYLDIDGTLRDEREGVPDSVIWALNECRKNKIQIVVCTGRNETSIQDDVRKLPWDGMICGGGCYIQYGGKTLWERYFPVEVIRAIQQYMEESHLLVSLETKEEIFMNRSAAGFYREDIERKMRECNPAQREQILRQNKIQYRENMKAFDCEKSMVHKVCIIGTKDQIEEIKALWNCEIEIAQEKQWNGKWYLELLPKGCDKGYAIRRLNQYLGISRNETMCFGDSENDIAMMEESGTSVVVKSNNRVIRQYASSVCESVIEDGIYKELIRRNIIQPKVKEVQCV